MRDGVEIHAMKRFLLSQFSGTVTALLQMDGRTPNLLIIKRLSLIGNRYDD